MNKRENCNNPRRKPHIRRNRLARVEEIGRTDRDNHERFAATSSHAFKHGYLEPPAVDAFGGR